MKAPFAITNALFLVTVATLGLLAGFLGWSAYAIFVGGQSWIYAENSILESAQAVILLIACLVFLLPVALERRSDKLPLLFCALVCYAGVLREVDVERFDLPGIIRVLGSGVGRNVTIAAAFLAILIFAAFRRRQLLEPTVRLVKSFAGVYLLAAGVFILAGELFEKYKFIPHHVYFEEVFELTGYVFIWLSSIAANLLFKRTER